MKNRTEENRRNLEMIAPTWTLLGLALTACGGGGGGGSSSGFGGRSPLQPVRFSTDPSTGTRSATVTESAQFRFFESLEPSDFQELYDSVPLPAGVTENQVSYDIDVTGLRTTRVTVMIEGHPDGTINVELTGDDASLLAFFTENQNAGITALRAFDYENPLDANQDNVYEASLVITTTDSRVPTNLRRIEQDYEITVRNNPADDRLPLASTTSGDIVVPVMEPGVGGDLSATIEETNDIVQLYAIRWDTTVATLNGITTSAFGPGTSIDAELQVASKTVTLVTTAFGSTSTSAWTITGDDADEFIFVEHGEGAVLQTVNPVDYENPRDANRDNVYEITLDTGGDALNALLGVSHLVSTGDIDYTITVTDNPNLDMI